MDEMVSPLPRTGAATETRAGHGEAAQLTEELPMFNRLVSLFALLILLAAPTAWAVEVAAPAPADPAVAAIHLNTASATELEQLPGIGPVLAERIVLYRADHGPFTQVDQLHDVKGVGDHLLERLQANLDL